MHFKKGVLPLILAFVVSLVFIYGCDKLKPCGECMTPPLFFYMELVDAENGENLISNGTFLPNQLDVVDAESKNLIDYEIRRDSILVIYGIGWQSEIVTASIRVKKNEVAAMRVNAERKSENCCSFTTYHEIAYLTPNFDCDSINGNCKILLKKPSP